MPFRLRTMLAVSLLLPLMAGCGGAPATPSTTTKPTAKAKTTTSQPPATGGPLGTVTIVAPTAGSTVTAGSVTVQLALSYFQFVSPRTGDAPGTGQVELSVNGTELGVFTFLKDTITLKTTGPQTLTAELLTNGTLIPSSKTSVAFTVTAPTASSGASSSTSSGQGSSSGSSPGSTSSGSTTSSSGSSSSSGPYTVTSHQATVSGHSETVLTDTQGLTLYYLNTDTSTTSTCTGSCASIWPPLLLGGTLSLAPNLPGYLTVIQDANGAQVVYDGHPLYTYSG
ncbi:MAG: hypothetical protein ACYCOS_07070, partial [Sulfobacillus sp.]